MSRRHILPYRCARAVQLLIRRALPKGERQTAGCRSTICDDSHRRCVAVDSPGRCRDCQVEEQEAEEIHNAWSCKREFGRHRAATRRRVARSKPLAPFLGLCANGRALFTTLLATYHTSTIFATSAIPKSIAHSTAISVRCATTIETNIDAHATSFGSSRQHGRISGRRSLRLR